VEEYKKDQKRKELKIFSMNKKKVIGYGNEILKTQIRARLQQF
jgi:hypothetical protein